MTTTTTTLLILFIALWICALIGTVFELISKRSNKPCQHEFTSELSSTSQVLCYDCMELKDI